MKKVLKKLLRPFGKQKSSNELTREELLIKAAKGSTYAIRNYHEALDRLAEYDRAK